MRINKKLKIVLLSLLVIFIVFNAFMIYHVIDRTNKAKEIDGYYMQISRIDFDKPIDSTQAVDVRNTFSKIPGVRKKITIVRNVVVYRYDKRITDSKKVYDEVIEKGKFKAQRFVLPTAMAGRDVCPAMKKDGFYYNYTQLVLRIFN